MIIVDNWSKGLNASRLSRLISSFKKSLMPKNYLASSVEDFIKERDKLDFTRTILPSAIKFNGSILVDFEVPLTVGYDRSKGAYFLADDIKAFAINDLGDANHLRIKCRDLAIITTAGFKVNLYSARVVYSPKTQVSKLWDWAMESYSDRERAGSDNPIELFGRKLPAVKS